MTNDCVKKAWSPISVYMLQHATFKSGINDRYTLAKFIVESERRYQYVHKWWMHFIVSVIINPYYIR